MSAPKLAAIAAELFQDLQAAGFGDPDADINGADLVELMAQYYARLDVAVSRALGRSAARQEPLALD